MNTTTEHWRLDQDKLSPFECFVTVIDSNDVCQASVTIILMLENDTSSICTKCLIAENSLYIIQKT